MSLADRLTAPIVLWGGLPFFQRGVASIRTRRFNMFTLIAIGSGAAYLFSLVALLIPQLLPAAFSSRHGAPLYFESAGVIIAFVLLVMRLFKVSFSEIAR